MSHRILLLFVCLGTGLIGRAQVLPAEGAKLSYTQIMFEYEKVKAAEVYLIQVAEDLPGSTFDHYLTAQKDSSTATMISDLEFGKKYKWRYAGITKTGEQIWKGPYHFEVEKTAMLKLDLLSLTVTTNDTGNAGGLIISDAIYAAIDRRGKVVWSLPKIDWHFNTARTVIQTDSSVDQVMKTDIRPLITDLRLTPYGTITYLTDSSLVECDINGNKLWEKHFKDSPSDKGEDNYNHVFFRMANGHYITLGKAVWRKASDYADSNDIKRLLKRTYNGTVYVQVDLGTVIEYDKAGNIVWSWSSRDYFDKEELTYLRSGKELKTHVNALGVDRSGQFVYVGFRDISRIIKIEKSTSKVVDSWGPRSPRDTMPMHHLNIYMQHDATPLDDSTMLIYNNNDHTGEDSTPSVMIFSQKPSSSGKVLWKYDYTPEPAMRGKSRIRGNADLLKSGNILVCTGSNHTIFEVTKSKKIVWQASFHAKEIPGYKYNYQLYRAHHVSSLYPCYFVFQTDRDTVTKRSSGFSIKVFNKGSEDDSYEVKILSASGVSTQHFTTQTLAAGKSVILHITPDDKLMTGDKMEIVLSSKTNPDLERRASVYTTN